MSEKPVHPGEELRNIILRLDFTQAKIAEWLEVSPQLVSKLVNKQCDINMHIAYRLGALFGSSTMQMDANYWLERQRLYDDACVAGDARFSATLVRIAYRGRNLV